MAWIYVGIVLVGLLSSYTTLVGLRSGLSANRVLIAAAGTIVALFLLSLVVWGFAVLDWYWPLVAFAAGAVIAWAAVNTANFALWYGISPVLYTVTAVGGIYLWFWNWPF